MGTRIEVGKMTKLCLLIIAIAVGLCYPIAAVLILVLASPVIGVVPLILYLFFISIVYMVKNMGE